MQGNICEMVPKIAEAKNYLRTELRRLPTCDEISEVVNIHVSTIRLVSEKNRTPLSLDQMITDRGCMRLQVLALHLNITSLIICECFLVLLKASRSY